MQLNDIQALVAKDMEGVNAHIRAQLHSDVALIEQMGEYIVNSGGKRLRPVLAILSARACGYSGHKHHLTAAIIEFIHTATLLHDDVVDASNLRRGKGDRQRNLGQRGLGISRRFHLFSFFRDDGASG